MRSVRSTTCRGTCIPVHAGTGDLGIAPEDGVPILEPRGVVRRPVCGVGNGAGTHPFGRPVRPSVAVRGSWTIGNRDRSRRVRPRRCRRARALAPAVLVGRVRALGHRPVGQLCDPGPPGPLRPNAAPGGSGRQGIAPATHHIRARRLGGITFAGWECRCYLCHQRACRGSRRPNKSVCSRSGTEWSGRAGSYSSPSTTSSVPMSGRSCEAMAGSRRISWERSLPPLPRLRCSRSATRRDSSRARNFLVEPGAAADLGRRRSFGVHVARWPRLQGFSFGFSYAMTQRRHL